VEIARSLSSVYYKGKSGNPRTLFWPHGAAAKEGLEEFACASQLPPHICGDRQVAKLCVLLVSSVYYSVYYYAVIDKFILSNYDNSICDLNIFIQYFKHRFQLRSRKFLRQKAGVFC
jgi:hypothetical protein